MPAPTSKNRRYRNAKISEYRLRRVVECFSHDKTVAETVASTRLSAPSINLIFRRLREQMRDYGLFVPQFDGQPHSMKVIFNQKHRGIPAHLHDLHAIEQLHRILCAQHLKGFMRLPASNPKNVEKAIRLMRFDEPQPVKRYRIWEALKEVEGNTDAPATRPFDPRHVRKDSDILVNEQHTSPDDAFFAYLWALLLRHPI